MSEKALKDAGYSMRGDFVFSKEGIVVGSLEPLEYSRPEGSSYSNAFKSMPLFIKSSKPLPGAFGYIESVSYNSMVSIIESLGLGIDTLLTDKNELILFTTDPKKVVSAAKIYKKFFDLSVERSIRKVARGCLDVCESDIDKFTEGIKKVFQKEFSAKHS